MRPRWLLIPTLLSASFLVHPTLAVGQTHLGTVPGNFVTLKLFAGVPGGCGPDGFEFRRMHANDGDADSAPFRVPAGFALVITDVEWTYASGSPGSQTLELFANVPPDLLGASLFLSVLNIPASGGASSEHRPMTAGFVLAEGTRLCATITPGGGILSSGIVRGYVASTSTSSIVEPPSRAGAFLGQSFPNPFASTAALDYDVEMGGNVEIRIYDVSGRVIRTLANGPQPAGRHRAVWDGRDETGGPVSPGVYFYQLKVANFVGSRRMVRLN